MPTSAERKAESLLVASFRNLPWDRKLAVLKITCDSAVATGKRSTYPRLVKT